jgi:hypothetical protein
MHPTSAVHRVTPTEAADYFLRCAEAVEKADDTLDEALAVILSVIETIHWESFTPEQRSAIKEWHLAVAAARKSLQLPDV